MPSISRTIRKDIKKEKFLRHIRRKKQVSNTVKLFERTAFCVKLSRQGKRPVHRSSHMVDKGNVNKREAVESPNSSIDNRIRLTLIPLTIKMCFFQTHIVFSIIRKLML